MVDVCFVAVAGNHNRYKQDSIKGSFSNGCCCFVLPGDRMGHIFSLVAEKDQQEIYDTPGSFGCKTSHKLKPDVMRITRWPRFYSQVYAGDSA